MREILSEKDMRITYLAFVEYIIADGIIAWGVLTNTSFHDYIYKSKYNDPGCFLEKVKISNEKCK